MAIPPFDLNDAGLTFAEPDDEAWNDVPWGRMSRLAAVDPAPAFLVEGADGLQQSFAPGAEDEDVFVARVSELFRRATEAGVEVQRGWLDRTPAPWEPVASLPDDDGDEVVVARRGAPSPSEALLLWLVHRARDLPGHRRVVLTRDHLYVERRDATIWRVPRAALHRTVRTRSGDLICTFGRDTRLILAGRAGCPVIDALQTQLDDA